MPIARRPGRTKALRRGEADADGNLASQQHKMKKAIYSVHTKKAVGVDDLTLLSTISNEAINANLHKRFMAGEIYDLGLYTDAVLRSYRGRNRLEMSPHVFATAESAFYQLSSYHENQCVIISGESGAGKTEAAKRIMEYVAAVSGHAGGSVSDPNSGSNIQDIKDIILATNPLLESFGCAKTLRNNNSSRHGKYLEIQFDNASRPIGAKITNYLLEKNRTVKQIKDERNFHIFYQFTKAAPKEYRDIFGVQNPESYTYTSISGCYGVNGIDDFADFNGTVKAMQTIGITKSEQDNIFRILAAILWIGNVQYAEKESGNAFVNDSSITEYIAYLLDVEPSLLNKSLTLRIMETQRGGRRGSIYEVPLNILQASAAREALAMALYDKLFDWIVSCVNDRLKPRGSHGNGNTFGILDIYGFEIFEHNSFEQLCINYVNEKLQQIFIELTLKAEQEEYVREQIQWVPIKYFNNKIVCDLIEERRPPGIFAALNDAIATAHADARAAETTFSQRLSIFQGNPHFEATRGQFTIKHYAGDVTYDQRHITDKNKDQLSRDLIELVQSSRNPFLQSLFPEKVDPNSKRRPPSAADKIKTSANELVQTLMQCHPSYIRTIKPNDIKSPKVYDNAAVLHQIKYLGLQENVRIRRAGFAYRQTFEIFVQRFFLLSPKTGYAGEYKWSGDIRQATKHIFNDTNIGPNEYQLGVTKVFIKQPEVLFALESMRDKYWHTMATRIQRAWRRYLRHKNECAARIQRLWRRSKEKLALIRLRDQGNQLVFGKKERRRMSLLARRFFYGDYLECNIGGTPGDKICKATGITERVSFSCRGELLISKLGRTSKPSPRSIILTNKALYIVITILRQSQVVHSIDRNISVGKIRFIAMTELQDCWMAVGLGSPDEADPLFRCTFKTEFITRLKQITPSLDVRIGPTIAYNRKVGAGAMIKAVRDETVKNSSSYKSSEIHICTGEPKDSIARQLADGGIKKSFSSQHRRDEAFKLASARQDSTAGQSRQYAVNSGGVSAGFSPEYETSRSTPNAQERTGQAYTESFAANTRRPAPPPPPPSAPPAAPAEPVFIALYDFQGQSESELSFSAGTRLKIVSKESNGWWLAELNGREGWVPETYIEEDKSAMRSAPAPPSAYRSQPSVQTTTKPGLNNMKDLNDALKKRNKALNDPGQDESDW